MKKIIVLYHKNCHDGFGAAYAAWKKFGTKADYVGVHHEEPFPKNLRGKDVYLLDFSYPVFETKKILSLVKSLTTIDHHKSVEKSTMMAHHFVFDNKHSGAVLAWKYFHPYQPVPKRLLYIEDLDLWKKKLPKTEDARATLNTLPYDFVIWDHVVKNFENNKGRKKILDIGSNIMAFQKKAIENILENAQDVLFCGYKTKAVNSPLFSDEIGSALANRILPPIGIVWSIRGNKLIVSLRSNGLADVSKLAAQFGGGGHKAASAFTRPANKKFPWKIIKK